MCVAVTLLPGAVLAPEEIWKMGMTNGDGVGVAWVDAETQQVKWYKTCNYKVKQIDNVVNYHINSPRLVHFRLSTVGGTRPDLCHPFAIDEKGTCAPVGTGPRVMIHNGHWHRYKELLDLMDKEGLLPDKGPWSDTRLIAYLANDDIDWLQIIGGKVATLDSTGQLTHYGDWDEYREGMRVSNKHWTTEKSYKTGGYSGFSKWPGWDGTWDEKAYEQFEADKRAKVEARKEEVRTAVAAVDSTNKNGARNGEIKEEKEPKEGVRGRGGGTTGHVGPAGSLGAVQARGEAGKANRLPEENGRGTPNRFDSRPWRNPATGRVYICTPEGRVVEAPPEPIHEEGKTMARNVAHQNPRHPTGHHRTPTPGPGVDTSGGEGAGAKASRSIHQLTQAEFEALNEWDGVILEELGGEDGE